MRRSKRACSSITFTYIHTHTYIHTYIHKYHKYTSYRRTYTLIDIWMYVSECVCAYPCAIAYVNVNVCLSVCMCASFCLCHCVYVCVGMYQSLSQCNQYRVDTEAGDPFGFVQHSHCHSTAVTNLQTYMNTNRKNDRDTNTYNRNTCIKRRKKQQTNNDHEVTKRGKRKIKWGRGGVRVPVPCLAGSADAPRGPRAHRSDGSHWNVAPLVRQSVTHTQRYIYVLYIYIYIRVSDKLNNV